MLLNFGNFKSYLMCCYAKMILLHFVWRKTSMQQHISIEFFFLFCETLGFISLFMYVYGPKYGWYLVFFAIFSFFLKIYSFKAIFYMLKNSIYSLVIAHFKVLGHLFVFSFCFKIKYKKIYTNYILISQIKNREN